MRVVGEAADGAAACRAATELRPDVLGMDLSMPVLSGGDATQIATRDCPDARIPDLTVHEESLYLTRLLRAGASGFVLKRSAPEELVRAVRAVAAGGRHNNPSTDG